MSRGKPCCSLFTKGLLLPIFGRLRRLWGLKMVSGMLIVGLCNEAGAEDRPIDGPRRTPWHASLHDRSLAWPRCYSRTCFGCRGWEAVALHLPPGDVGQLKSFFFRGSCLF